MSWTQVVAVLAALGAAVLFGVSSVLMWWAAQAVPAADLLHLRLLRRLLASRMWVLGAVLQAVSFGVLAVALRFGPLALVQPIAAADLLFAFPVLARAQHRRMRRIEWGGAVLVVAGVSVFLGVSLPRSGLSIAHGAGWLAALLISALLIGATSFAATRSSGMVRTTLLAVAGAVDFGLVDVLTKSLTGIIAKHGYAALVARWEFYALLVAGVSGLVLSQSAFRAGRLQVSLPVIDSLEPTIAVVIGVLVFGESLAHNGGELAAQLIGAAAAVSGIVLLDRSPTVAGRAAA